MQIHREVEHNRLDARSARAARSDGDGAARKVRVHVIYKSLLADLLEELNSVDS